MYASCWNEKIRTLYIIVVHLLHTYVLSFGPPSQGMPRRISDSSAVTGRHRALPAAPFGPGAAAGRGRRPLGQWHPGLFDGILWVQAYMYTCIYIYVSMYAHRYIYIHAYKDRYRNADAQRYLYMYTYIQRYHYRPRYMYVCIQQPIHTRSYVKRFCFIQGVGCS